MGKDWRTTFPEQPESDTSNAVAFGTLNEKESQSCFDWCTPGPRCQLNEPVADHERIRTERRTICSCV
jgi:hypothetical protein